MLHRSISNRLIVGLGAVALAVLLLAVGSVMRSDAATAPGLGAASSFAVLAGSTVTNTGPSTVNGDLGVSPGSAVTGFFTVDAGPGIMTGGGTIHQANATSLAAQSAVTTAYNALAGEPCGSDLTGMDLGSMTLTPGVYCFSSSAFLSIPAAPTLTLNALGDPAAVFIFQIGSTLITASNATVLMTNGGLPCNVFWQVGSSATIGTGTDFVGNILALTSITLNNGADLSGRALARNGAVTMDTNDVDSINCATATPTATAGATASPTATAGATANPSAVGGAAALTVSDSGSSVPWALLAAVAVGAMAVMGAGLWYGRRRLLN